MGYGDHDLIPDDEASLARVVQLHSADKDYYAYRFADIVSTAMRGKFSSLWWLELFAGPGRLWVAPEQRFRAGSPVRATSVRWPFDGYVFNDMDPECYAALAPRVAGERTSVLCGDANSDVILDQIMCTIPKSALVVLYADPAGLDLHFETLARLAEHFPHLD